MEILNEDGTFTETWRESLPEDIREDETLKNISDLPGMAKMLVHSQKLVGADKIAVPGEFATEDDWNAVFTKLGKPENPDGYTLEKPEGIPEGLEYSDDIVANYREVAHKHGLLPAQAKALFDWYNNLYIEGHKSNEKAKEMRLLEAETQLKKDFGAAYDQRVELAKTTIRSFADEDAIEALEEGLGNDPRMVKLFAKIGEAISEDKLKGSKPIYTPTEAQSEIDSIMGNLDHPYHKKDHPGHAAAVEKMKLLYSQVYPAEG